MKRGALFLLFLFFFGCGKFFDWKPPYVEKTVPADGERGVKPDAAIKIYFSEKMDKTSTEAAFSIDPQIEGVLTWEGEDVLVFQPSKRMETGKRYTVKIASSAMDLAGNRLSHDFSFRFYTSTSQVAPRVVSISPADGESVLDLRRKIEIVFSRSMDRRTTELAFSISPQVEGTFSWSDSKTLVFTPAQDYSPSVLYTIKIASSACDTEGFAMGVDFTSSFFTGVDTQPPKVLGVFTFGDPSKTYWTNPQEGLEKDISIAVEFSEPMDVATTQEAFSLTPEVPGYFEWIYTDGVYMVFHPTEKFATQGRYVLKISNVATDKAGFKIEKEFTINFVVNGPHSVYLNCESAIGEDGLNLSTTDVNQIDMVSTVPADEYAVTFAFSAPVDVNSFQNSIGIEYIGGPVDYSSYTGTIKSFDWSMDKTQVTVTFADLHVENYYRISIQGGEEGVTDQNENPLKESLDYIIINP